MRVPDAPGRASEPRALRALGASIRVVCACAMALSAAALLLSLGLLGWAVVMRYLLNQPTVWTDDAVGFLLVAVVMGAAAQVLRRGEHIGVDLLTERLSPRMARWAQAWAQVAVLAVALILIFNGWQTAMQSRQFGVVTEGHLEWPVWYLMLMLPAGGALMALVAVEGLWRLALGLPLAEAFAGVPESPGLKDGPA